jgi:hypothetical protein
MKRITAAVAIGLMACGGRAVDYLPDGGESATATVDAGAVGEKWCIGCLAGVSVPQSIPNGYGLRPINETIGGRSLQFPSCQGTQSSMPHACRTPTGNAVFFGSPPSSWSSGTKGRYWDAVYRIGAELSSAGKTWATAHNGGTDPWDSGVSRYQHTEVLVKPNISNSPHPLFKLTLQGIQNTAVTNIKTYLACEIQFDFAGPVGISNNGGHCSGACAESWSPQDYDSLRQNAFLRALSRCIGQGGNQLPIHQHNVGSSGWDDNCWSVDGWQCSAGGGDGMLRKEWFPDGWWSQRYWKNCLGDSPQEACGGIFPTGGNQYASGLALLQDYQH